MKGRALRAQTKLELILNLRRGEAVLLTLIIPVGLLVFFGTTELFAVTVEFITPGLLALAVLSSSLVSLSIATGYERKYLVLKRLGATPLPRSVLFVAKAISILVLEIIQIGLLLAVAALFFGWRADINWWLLIGALLVGTAAFSGLAMLMAGTLRAEATLALANGLYVIFLLVGDVIFPLESLPDAVVRLGQVMPAAPAGRPLPGGGRPGRFRRRPRRHPDRLGAPHPPAGGPVLQLGRAVGASWVASRTTSELMWPSSTPITPMVVAQAKKVTSRPWAISMNSGTPGICWRRSSTSSSPW